MRLSSFLFFIVLFLGGNGVTTSFAQEEADSTEVSKAAKNAKTDELYFEALKARN